jgi:hypothetical protein
VAYRAIESWTTTILRPSSMWATWSSTPTTASDRVIGNQQRRLVGRERSYLEIDLVDSTLTIMIPCESIGLPAESSSFTSRHDGGSRQN